MDRTGHLIPFEVKYQSQVETLRDIQGLVDFCRLKEPIHGYVLTKAPQDIGALENAPTKLMRIPASLFCYWLGESELEQNGFLNQ